MSKLFQGVVPDNCVVGVWWERIPGQESVAIEIPDNGEALLSQLLPSPMVTPAGFFPAV